MITVLNMDGRELTPCIPDRAWREVNRERAVWINEHTIKLLYNPFRYREYRKAALKRDLYLCLWCGCPAATVDHIVPASKGGTDLPNNLLASCSDCNTRRGNASAIHYLATKARTSTKLLYLVYRITIAYGAVVLSKWRKS